ncbi:hypothetical protein ONZ45_g966 [Pleurotus djamor]|nr:hypothetical protein ONZ45_g966 [Pleurotus djamor]
MSDQNFSGALETWKEINLSELQKTLDAQGIDLVDQQKESVLGRKALAEKTKDFKKLPDSEKSNSFKGLLKAYQTEIDNLTKRCKASENAFLSVYKLLAEAPDPYPLLEAAVDQTVQVAEAREQELQLQRLRDENAELRKQVSEFSTLDAAKKKAELVAEQLEQKMEDMIQEKVSQKENELHATYDERIRNYEEREQDLQRQVTLAKNQLRDLRTSHETNQAKLIDQTQRQDQEVVAKLSEVDMIAADLERANSRVATLERRNEILRAEMESIKSGNDTNDRTKTLESQLSQLEAELERISISTESQKAQFSELEVTSSKRVAELSKELQKKISDIDQMKLRLKQYADYDEIKRELEIMKFVEFGGFDDGEDAEETPEGEVSDERTDSTTQTGIQLPNPNADKANAHRGKALEILLAAKNARILGELTNLRNLHSSLEASYQLSEKRAEEIATELAKQKALNERLENDLLSVNQHRTTGREDALPTNDSSDVLAELGIRSTKVTELRKQFQVISELRSEIKNLQTDNLKLYEKVRYMQSYREEKGSRPLTSQLDPLPAPSGAALDDIGKYRARKLPEPIKVSTLSKEAFSFSPVQY